MRRFVIFAFYLAVLALAVVLLHLTPGLDKSHVEIQVRNSLHVIGFAAVALLTIRMTPGGAFTRAIVALLVATSIGAASEFSQQVAGSLFDVEDLYRDIGGATLSILAWLVWIAPLRFGFSALGRFVLRALALLLGLSVFVPFAYWSGVFLIARAEAPVIHDFDHDWARYYVASINSSFDFVRDAEEAHVAVTLSKRPRSGVTLAVAGRDWSGADDLVFDAWISHSIPVTLSVHINGRNHVGRFRDTAAGTVIVNESPGTYRVAIADVIAETQASDDISDIRQLIILGRDKTDGAVLHIDNIRIE